jgi:hypothetical protein
MTATVDNPCRGGGRRRRPSPTPCRVPERGPYLNRSFFHQDLCKNTSGDNPPLGEGDQQPSPVDNPKWHAATNDRSHP